LPNAERCIDYTHMTDPKPSWEGEESVPIHRPEDTFKNDLNEKLQQLLLQEKDIDDAQAKIDQIADSIDGESDPDFSWVPASLIEQVHGMWMESQAQLNDFKQDEKMYRAALAEKQSKEVAGLRQQESSVAGGRISELQTKILKEPKPMSQRDIKTQVIKRPEPTWQERLGGLFKRR